MHVGRRIFAALCYAMAGFAAVYASSLSYGALSHYLWYWHGIHLPEPNIWLIAGIYFLLPPFLAVLALRGQLPGTRPKRRPTSGFDVVAKDGSGKAPADS